MVLWLGPFKFYKRIISIIIFHFLFSFFSFIKTNIVGLARSAEGMILRFENENLNFTNTSVRIISNSQKKKKKFRWIVFYFLFSFSLFAKIKIARDASKERRERQEQYLRRQKLRSCPLVRATILGTQGTVYRVSSLVGHTRILRSTPCCLRTVVPFRGTPIVRPSCLPETSLASRPSPRPSPIFSRSRRPPLNAS